jgi:hypothetical protein
VTDQSFLPPHLRDDAPCQTCDRCGRKTWDVQEFGGECRMPQKYTVEMGWHQPCGGRFQAVAA